MKYGRLKTIILFSIILLIALIVRIHHLDHESLWMDELRQVSYYPLGFKQIVAAAASQQQPPLDYWIGHIVYFFSSSDFAVRLPSVLFGLGTVFLVIVLTNSATNVPVAAGVGLIAAFLPFNLYFSQEARPYSIAIFLCLSTIYLYHKTVSSSEDVPKQSIGLLFILILFLYSRSLAPLVVVCSLFVFSILLYIFKKATLTKTTALIIIIITAILIFIPTLNYILSFGKKYLAGSDSISILDSIRTGIDDFDITPLWKAFYVQTEPLTYPLLFLTMISPVFIWKQKQSRGISLSILCFFLLFFASLMHLFIFQAKTDMPFRPPYVIYMSPLVLILSAVGFNGIILNLKGFHREKTIKIIILCIGIAFIIQNALSALDFKANRIKTDWRGLCRHLSDTYGPETILIFDALSLYGNWEPTFFGFSRYYKGDSSLTSMSWLPLKLPQNPDIKPVIVLFQWNELRLRPESEYTFLKHSENNKKPVNYKIIIDHPEFVTKQFKNFTVIRLKNETGNFANDAYVMINELIEILPEDASLIELHLAAGALAKRIGMVDFRSHFYNALKLANDHQKDRLLQIIPQI